MSEGEILHRRAGTDAYAETREVIQNFLIGENGGLFSGLIDEIAAHGTCSGKFSDANIERECPFQRGQRRLELIGLPGIVKWLQTFGARADPKEPPADLLSFLNSSHVTVAKLKLELTDRGIKISSSSLRKSEIADAIYAHVLSNVDGYVNQVDGRRMP